MIAQNIHHALAQVRELEQRVLLRQKFRGYSGVARAFSGTLALGAAGLFASSGFPKTAAAGLIGWGIVFALSLGVNYGALLHWFFFDPGSGRDLRRLRPTFDVFPSIFVGGALSAALIHQGNHACLYGIWMSLFGLAHVASRHALPKANFYLGLFYIACGTACLMVPEFAFPNPWPMGIVFFFGEWAGGLVFRFDRSAEEA